MRLGNGATNGIFALVLQCPFPNTIIDLHSSYFPERNIEKMAVSFSLDDLKLNSSNDDFRMTTFPELTILVNKDGW